jgi:hypothetical protein
VSKPGRTSVSATMAFVCALAPITAWAQAHRILPDSVNIPVLEGSALLEPCVVAHWPADEEPLPTFRPPHAQCVTGAMRGSTNLQNAYVSELRRAGWDFEGGAPNVFFFERPTDVAGCRQALDFIGLPRDRDDNSAGIIFVFALRPEPICRSEQ